MNHLELVPAVWNSDPPQVVEDFLDYAVDGQPLAELVRVNSPNLVTDFGTGEPPPLDYLRGRVDQLLGLKPGGFADDRVAIYLCPCGDIYCGAATVRIQVNKDSVEWNDWYFENNLDYFTPQPIVSKGLSNFIFARSDYFELIDTAYDRMVSSIQGMSRAQPQWSRRAPPQDAGDPERRVVVADCLLESTVRDRHI